MGVIPCYRGDCENIMCDRQGPEGNLCNECFDELVELGVGTDLDDFMESDKKPPGQDGVDSYAYWNERFPIWGERH